MTEDPGDTGARPSSGDPAARRRPGFKPAVAAAVVAGPLLVLVLLNAAALVQAFVDPSSTCWLAAQIQDGRRVVYPFEIHLLFFTATMQFWMPIALLMAALFWYLDWIRLSELLGVALLSAAVLYFVGIEYQWMVELYRGRFEVACV